MQKNPCSGLDVNPLHPSMTLQDYQDAVSLEDGLYPIEGNSADYTYIDADAIGYKTTSVGDVLKYSTTEHIVGEWIDGAPVYEKTINFGNLPNNTTKSVSHGITNLDKCIEIKGVMANGAGTTFYCLPFPDTTAIANNLFIYCNGTSVSITAAANYSTNTAYITLRYTKTS